MTELLVIGSSDLSASQLPSFTAIDRSVIQPSHSARNIAVLLHNELNMERQVYAICKSAFFHIRNISWIRKFLSLNGAKPLVHAFVTCSLQAGSHLGAHARAAKSEFESEAILREESGDEARRK